MEKKRSNWYKKYMYDPEFIPLKFSMKILAKRIKDIEHKIFLLNCNKINKPVIIGEKENDNF